MRATTTRISHARHKNLSTRVQAFVEDSSAASFADLALETIRIQADLLPGYRRLFDARCIDPETIDSWQQAPPIPTSAFQQQVFNIGGVEQVFRSSGTSTSGQQRSEHHHGNLDLYRHIIDTSFPEPVLGTFLGSAPVRRPILSLIAPVALIPDSSLGFMIAHVIDRYGTPDAAYAFEDGVLAPQIALDWIAVQPQDSKPVILATALALWTVLEHIKTTEPAVGWPSSTVVMETGGFKTRRFEIDRERLLRRLRESTGVPELRVVREYGMTELSSQAYASTALSLGDNDLFKLPHWVRARALDPVTMQERTDAEPGLLAFLDLGNIASAASIVTEDLGIIEPEGRAFRLLGRAADAELRGCSLSTEALLGSTAR